MDKLKTLTTKAMGIFKKEFIVGLDIGRSSLKIVQLAKKEDGLHLVKAAMKEIKKTEDAALRQKETVSALKDLCKGINLKKSKVIATLNCPKTAVKITKAPYMPKAELRKGIALQAKNYFPFPVDDSELDYEILGDVVEKGIRKYEILVSVSPKATIEKNLALLEKAGIKPASLVPTPYALQKLACSSHSKGSGAEDKAICLVDIGEVHTELVISKGANPLFMRKIPLTGFDFTKALTGALVSDRGKTELSLDEAEKIKRETGIPALEGETKIIDGKISTTEMLSMMRTPLEQLISEIDRCFDYYRETGSGRIDSLVLFGGGAALGGLIKFLSDELGIEVRLGDPIGDFKIPKEAIADMGKVSYRLGHAVGAALTEGRGTNLLPPEIKQEIKRVVTRGTIEVVVTAVVLASLLLYIGMKIQLGNFEKRITVAKREIASLKAQFKKAEAHHLAGMVLVDEPHWEDVFRELGHLIPNDIHLTDMGLQNGVITMRGIVASTQGEHILSAFIITLEKGIFKNVKLVRTRDLEDRSGSEFEIECRVD